jgi:hypothetical protein
VLEGLVRVHDVEAVVGEVECVGVANPGVDAELAGLLDHLGRRVDADDVDAHRRHVGRDRAGAAAHVENGRPVGEIREEIRGRVLDSAPGVRAQHRLVVAVRIVLVGMRLGGHAPA